MFGARVIWPLSGKGGGGRGSAAIFRTFFTDICIYMASFSPEQVWR